MEFQAGMRGVQMKCVACKVEDLEIKDEEFEIPYNEEITLDRKRNFDYYDRMLYKAFSEINKVLKENKYMTVTFHNSQPRVFNFS